MAAAPAVRREIALPAALAELQQVGDGRLRAGNDDEPGILRQSVAGTHENHLDLRLGLQRVEIVEVMLVPQRRRFDEVPGQHRQRQREHERGGEQRPEPGHASADRAGGHQATGAEGGDRSETTRAGEPQMITSST